MKKFILKCTTILIMLIVLSFLIPSLTMAEASQRINIKVTKASGGGIGGIIVSIIDTNTNQEVIRRNDEV